jgi:predicted transcriptional regulator
MTVHELAQKLGLSVAAGSGMENTVTGAYAGDLLSDVIAHSKQGEVWITMQVHANIVAVAVLKELAAIILVNGRHPPDDTVRKAVEEGIPLLLSTLPTYTVAGRLYTLGVGEAP